MNKLILAAVPVLIAFVLLMPKPEVSGEVIHVSADDMIYETVDNGFYELKLPKADWKYKSEENLKVIFGMYTEDDNSGVVAYIIKEQEYPFEIDFSNNETQTAFRSAVESQLNETELVKIEGGKDNIEFVMKYFDSGLNQWVVYSDVSFLCGDTLVKMTTKAMDTHLEQIMSLNSELVSGFICKISLG